MKFEGYSDNHINKSSLKSVYCNSCGFKITISPENLSNGFLYLCPKCHNKAAIKYINKAFQPQEILSLNWNKGIIKRAVPINDILFYSEGKTKKDSIARK